MHAAWRGSAEAAAGLGTRSHQKQRCGAAAAPPLTAVIVVQRRVGTGALFKTARVHVRCSAGPASPSLHALRGSCRTSAARRAAGAHNTTRRCRKRGESPRVHVARLWFTRQRARGRGRVLDTEPSLSSSHNHLLDCTGSRNVPGTFHITISVDYAPQVSCASGKPRGSPRRLVEAAVQGWACLDLRRAGESRFFLRKIIKPECNPKTNRIPCPRGDSACVGMRGSRISNGTSRAEFLWPSH